VYRSFTIAIAGLSVSMDRDDVRSAILKDRRVGL
jgi:hypothetical protein